MSKRLYYQIVRKLILKQLKSGELRPGDKLPSERELCEQTELNRNTVRHALLMLQREGKVFRLERRGWYVSPVRLIYNPADHVNFARLASSQGRESRWSTKDKGIVAVDEDVDGGGEDGFPMGARVYEMENIFFLEDQRVAYTLNYLNADRLEGIIPKTLDRAMTQVVEEDYGIMLKQKHLLIRPQLLPKEVSNELNVSLGSPGVYVRRIKTDGRHEIMTVEHEFWRFDAIELQVTQ